MPLGAELGALPMPAEIRRGAVPAAPVARHAARNEWNWTASHRRGGGVDQRERTREVAVAFDPISATRSAGADAPIGRSPSESDTGAVVHAERRERVGDALHVAVAEGSARR